MVENAVSQYKAHGMPLDVVFLDIPYMSGYVDFTVNKTAFPNLTAFVKELHSNRQHLIPIVDAAISADDTSNKYYQLGNKENAFIKSAIHQNETYSNNLINQVWPNISVFVDWFNENSTKMWFTGLDDLYNETLYDGIWIDMNEPWGFQTGELDPKNITWVPVSSPEQPVSLPRCKKILMVTF